MPEPEFEKALAEPGVKSTHKILAAHQQNRPVIVNLKKPAKPLSKVECALTGGDIASAASRQSLCEAVTRLAASGATYPESEVKLISGFADLTLFLGKVRMLPWLTVTRLAEGYRFEIDEELRAICEQRISRPELGGLSIYRWVQQFAKEIDRRRRENNEKRKTRNWNTDMVLKVEQKHLLDWIEAEVSKLNRLMATPGEDCASESRTQKSIPLDRDQETPACIEKKGLASNC